MIENCTLKVQSHYFKIIFDVYSYYFQMILNLKNTASQFKRLIGRKFSDPIVAEEKKRQTCQLVEMPGDYIGVKVHTVHTCGLYF